jgi:outer membrane protein OmpA-like peptidoglycan-associated protein
MEQKKRKKSNMERDEQKKKVSLSKVAETKPAAVAASSTQGNKISLNKQPEAEPAVAAATFPQGKKVSLNKQSEAEPAAAAAASPEPRKKISLNKQTQEIPAIAPAATIAVPPLPAVSASSVFTVSTTPLPVSKPMAASPAHPAPHAGDRTEKALSGQKTVGIIAGIIGIIIIAVVFLLRNCGSKKQAAGTAVSQTEFVQPSSETTRKPEPGLTQETFRQPESLSDPEFILEQGPPVQPGFTTLTYDAFYFPGNSDSFLPGLNYQERLSIIAQDIKNILTVKPGQVFLISGYSADIPGHTQGELELSVQRADRVRDALIQLGVPRANLECAYRGGTNKWGDNSSESERSPNRVVTVELRN